MQIRPRNSTIRKNARLHSTRDSASASTDTFAKGPASEPAHKSLLSRLRAKAKGVGTVAGAAVGATLLAAGATAGAAVVVPAALGVGALAFGLSAVMTRTAEKTGYHLGPRAAMRQIGKESTLTVVKKQSGNGAFPWLNGFAMTTAALALSVPALPVVGFAALGRFAGKQVAAQS